MILKGHGDSSLCSVPFLWTWIGPSDLLLLEYNKSDGMSLLSLNYRKLWQLSCLYLYSRLLSYSDEISCHAVTFSVERPTWQGSERQQPVVWQPMRNWILPTIISELESGSFPVEPIDDCNLVRDLELKHPSKSCTDSWTTETEIINVYCFKLLKFGINYHAAIDK